jgi:hypothetical protein
LECQSNVNPRKGCGCTRIGQGILAQGCSGHPLKMTSPVSGVNPTARDYTIGEDHEKQNQNKQSIITRYGDRQGALTGVRGWPDHIGVCPFREC